jgi:hypothetical protein
MTTFQKQSSLRFARHQFLFWFISSLRAIFLSDTRLVRLKSPGPSQSSTSLKGQATSQLSVSDMPVWYPVQSSTTIWSCPDHKHQLSKEWSCPWAFNILLGDDRFPKVGSCQNSQLVSVFRLTPSLAIDTVPVSFLGSWCLCLQLVFDAFGLESYSVAPTDLRDFRNIRGKFPGSFYRRPSQGLTSLKLGCSKFSLMTPVVAF